MRRLQLGIQIGQDDPGPDSHMLPLRPVWSGFAINAIFYAAIVWFMLVIPGAIRRRRRIKRGLCVGCAYPVGISEKCTECGTAVKPAS